MNAQRDISRRDLFSGVNRQAYPRNASDLEKKHIPVIDGPSSVKLGECFTVTIEVGKTLPHPNERDHFIEFMDLYADEFFLARVDLTSVNTYPKADLCIALTSRAKELRAYARCNTHGVWAGTRLITVQA